MYTWDWKGEFLDLGHGLFNDKEALKTHGFAADIFAPSSALGEMDGKIDAIYAASSLRTYISELIL